MGKEWNSKKGTKWVVPIVPIIQIKDQKRVLYFSQNPQSSIVNMGRWYI